MNDLIHAVINQFLQLFLVLDPVGSIGIIGSMLSRFSRETQARILNRELFFALCLMFVFYFTGSMLLDALHISQSAVQITGGIVFLLFSISLLFPAHSPVDLKSFTEEPYLVPIAIPLIVGPSAIATIVLYSHQTKNSKGTIIAIACAWFVTALIVRLGPLLFRKMGKTGMSMLENLIGLVCALVAVKMLVKGITHFLATIS